MSFSSNGGGLVNAKVILNSVRQSVCRLPLVHLLVIFCIAVFPMLLYGDGLLSPLSLDLQTSPSEYWVTSFYSWQSKQSLGTSFNAQGWLFPSATFFSLFSFIGIPGWLTARIWYVAILFTAGVSMYFYMTWILHRYASEAYGNKTTKPDENKRRIALCSLVAAIGYMANPYVVLHINNGHFLVPYALLPLQLLILDKGLHSGRLYYAALLGLLSIVVTTNLPILAINYIIISSYIAYYFWATAQSLSTRTVKFICVYFALSFSNLLWFVLPLAITILNADSTIAAAQAQESWQMYGMRSSVSETFRLMGIWPLYSSGVEFSDYYLNNLMGILTTSLIPILAIVGLAYLRGFHLTPLFLLILVLSIFMAVGGHVSNPFRNLYIFCYDHVPLFAMFRNGYKFVGMIAFIYVLLISIGLYYWISRKSFNEKKRSYAATVVILVFILASLPLFRGQIFAKNQLAVVPPYWSDVAKWLDSQHDHSRVMLLPDQYFDTYKWGGYAGFFSSAPYISNDVIANGSSNSGNEIIQKLYKPFSYKLNPSTNLPKDNISDDNFCNSIASMSIRYLLQRNDIDTSIYHVASPALMKMKLRKLSCVALVKSFGKVDIYEITRPSLPRLFISPLNELQ